MNSVAGALGVLAQRGKVAEQPGFDYLERRSIFQIPLSPLPCFTWLRLSLVGFKPDRHRRQNTNIPIAAPNIRAVAIAATTRVNIELS